MGLFAGAPPPSGGQCFVLATIFGLLASACLGMAFRRLRSRHDPVASAKWIAIAASAGGLIAALTGPIPFAPDATPHWIGYGAQRSIMRAFLGTVAGVLFASFLIRCCGLSRSPHRAPAFQFRISSLLLFIAFAALVGAMLSRSAYAGSFVLLELLLMVGTFTSHVLRSGHARDSADTGNQYTGQSASVKLVAERSSRTDV